MEYADVCHATPLRLPPHSYSSSLAEIELTSAAAAAAPCQLPGPMHRPNRKYMRVYLQPLSSTSSFPPPTQPLALAAISKLQIGFTEL